MPKREPQYYPNRQTAYWCTLYGVNWHDEAGGMFTDYDDCLKFVTQLLKDEDLLGEDSPEDSPDCDPAEYIGSCPLLFKGEQPNETPITFNNAYTGPGSFPPTTCWVRGVHVCYRGGLPVGADGTCGYPDNCTCHD